MPKYFFFSYSDIVIFLCLIGLAALSAQSANAFKMTNANYTILEGNLNSVAGKPTNANYKLGITVGELGSGLYSGTNYKVRAGFQYIYSIIKFQFSLSSILIDFGTLTPTNPVTRTQTLTISNGSAHGYTVTASENHPLLVDSTGAVIPDTTCDSGTCTESTSSAWSNTLTYGFGYRCDNISGTDCATGFSTGTFYKQFPDLSASETAQSVMTGANVGRNKQVQITYKANISGTQPGGEYRNIITYIATPTL